MCEFELINEIKILLINAFLHFLCEKIATYKKKNVFVVDTDLII